MSDFQEQRPRREKKNGTSLNVVFPNILTMLGLCSGLTAMRFATESLFAPAVIAILVSAIIDGLDGRLARLLKATSSFGAEFDSLSDFVCFGVAPAFTVYLWALQNEGGLGFIPPLLFTVCMGLRLARFNATLNKVRSPAYAYFFTGVPAPAGALLALFPLFLWLEGRSLGLSALMSATRYPLLPALILVGTGFLLVSTLPIWSFKNFRLRSGLVVPILVGIGAYVSFLIAEPWAALAALGVIYIFMIPLSYRSFKRLNAGVGRKENTSSQASDH